MQNEIYQFNLNEITEKSDVSPKKVQFKSQDEITKENRKKREEIIKRLEERKH